MEEQKQYKNQATYQNSYRGGYQNSNGSNYSKRSNYDNENGETSRGGYSSNRGRGRGYYNNYNNSYDKSENYQDNYHRDGGANNNYRGRGRGGYQNRDQHHQDQKSQKSEVAVVETPKQQVELIKKGTTIVTVDYEKAFSNMFAKAEVPKKKMVQQESKADKQPVQEMKEQLTNDNKSEEVKQEQKIEGTQKKQNGIKQDDQKVVNGVSNSNPIAKPDNLIVSVQAINQEIIKADEIKEHVQQPEQTQKDDHLLDLKEKEEQSQDQSTCINNKLNSEIQNTDGQQTEKQTEDQKSKEEAKPKEKVDFIPDPNFSWDLAEMVMKPAPKKKKKKAATSNGNSHHAQEMVPIVIKQDQSKAIIKENIKLKLTENLEFSTLNIDKLNKGLKNSTNCCYMNVVLQSLFSIPAFFNMLIAISDNQEVMKELGSESLLRKFVYLSQYFNPTCQMDKKSPFAAPTVDAERIFIELNQNFNPYQEHQDCHEFLAIVLDFLHDELKLIYVPNDDTASSNQVVDEWQEVGNKNSRMLFNNDLQNIQRSLVRDIFGGVIRSEFQISQQNKVSVTYEPFFVLNLEITRCEDLYSCLHSFFKTSNINDYMHEGKLVYATHHQQIEKLPKILILQLKRFVFHDKPIKKHEIIDFPQVLKVEDYCLSTHLRLGINSKKSAEESGRHYLLSSVTIHRGTDVSKGHYTCFVLDASNNWVHYDDAKVKKVSEDYVYESQAYLLFYELIQ